MFFAHLLFVMPLFDEAYEREDHDWQKNCQYQGNQYSSYHGRGWNYWGGGEGEGEEININHW